MRDGLRQTRDEGDGLGSERWNALTSARFPGKRAGVSTLHHGRKKRVEVNALHLKAANVAEYPQRLHHETPSWVKVGSLFHVRIRVDAAQARPLTEPRLSADLIKAAQRYHELGNWWCELVLLMPDHLHALLRFPNDPGMAAVLGNWKRGTARFQEVKWQDNFFDHRIRSQAEANLKWHYIRLNPTAKLLCAREEDWPHWWSGALSKQAP